MSGILCYCSVTKLYYPALCNPMDCSMPGFPVLRSLPGFAQIHVHWVDGVIQPFHPLPPLFLLLSNLSQLRIFSSGLVLHIRWPKYWSFSFNITPSNEYSGLIFFRIDWFDLLAVHWSHKRLLQHHNLKASILQHAAFFMVQIPRLYMMMGRQWKPCQTLFLGAPKSLQMVIAAMKLKDAYSLEGKLWPA